MILTQEVQAHSEEAVIYRRPFISDASSLNPYELCSWSPQVAFHTPNLANTVVQ